MLPIWLTSIFVLCALTPIPVLAESVWVRNLVDTERIDVKEWIVKWPAFHRSGRLRVAPWQRKRLLPFCNRPGDKVAWVSHRLPAHEVLTPKAGAVLGEALLASTIGTCFSAIELDIEPMPRVPTWLSSFLQEVRKKLQGKLSLRIATPAIQHAANRGLGWRADELQMVAGVADGLDVMLYDTGTSTPEDYQAVARATLEALAVLPAQTSLRIGLPIYDDKTGLHRPEIETLETISPIVLSATNVICRPNVSLAYYAAWTIDDQDKTAILRLNEQKSEKCKGIGTK